MFILNTLLRRLRLLPLICLVSASPQSPAFTEFFNDFPEARALVGPSGRTFTGTLWQTAGGNLARVSFLYFVRFWLQMSVSGPSSASSGWPTGCASCEPAHRWRDGAVHPAPPVRLRLSLHHLAPRHQLGGHQRRGWSRHRLCRYRIHGKCWEMISEHL